LNTILTNAPYYNQFTTENTLIRENVQNCCPESILPKIRSVYPCGSLPPLTLTFWSSSAKWCSWQCWHTHKTNKQWEH